MTGTLPDGPAAVLIDLDGTLVDTVDVWHRAYEQLAAELATTLTDDFWPSIAGLSMQGSLTVFGPAAAVHDPDALVARLVGRATDQFDRPGSPGWDWLPGAAELLDLLWSSDVGGGPRPRTALVTSAWRTFTDRLLDSAYGGRTPGFDAIVCGDDVAHPKPSPEPYLRAAGLLDVAPHDCLVIEDSPTGVAAAEAAGMVVLAVPHAGPVDAAAGRAVRTDLTRLTLEDLASLYVRLRSGSSH